MMQRNEKSRFAFINGSATQHYIYLLYSGLHENEDHPNDAKFIFVYDWDGKPVMKFTLDRFITSFTVSATDDVMYAFDESAKAVVKTKIKL